MCFMNDRWRELSHSESSGFTMNKNQRIGNEALRNLRVVETKNECKFSPMAENKPGLRNEMINGIEGMGFSSICRQKFGHLNFELSAIAVVCAAATAFYAAPVFAETSVSQGVYLNLLSGDAEEAPEVDGSVYTLSELKDNSKREIITVNYQKLNESISGSVDVDFVNKNEQTAINVDQKYTGKTYIKSGYNHQVNVYGDLVSSEAINVDRTSQIYFMRDAKIKALEGEGRVGMDKGKVLIVDYEGRLADVEELTISKQFLAQSKVVFTKDAGNRTQLKFNVNFTKDPEWAVPAPEEDWGFESMTFKNFELTMDDEGTYKYLGLDKIKLRVNPNKNIHLADGSLMLFSPGGKHKDQYELGGLYLEGGTLNFENLVLDHDKFAKNVDQSTLTVHEFKPVRQGTGIEVKFAERADSNFNLWNNQDEVENYFIKSKSIVSDKNGVHLILNEDGVYKQQINQAASQDADDDATLIWHVKDVGWESFNYPEIENGQTINKTGEALKYSSQLVEIQLTNKNEGSGFVVNAGGKEESKELKAKLTGSGHIKFVNGTVLLNRENAYEGNTFVAQDSNLILGHTKSLGTTQELSIEGTVNASQVDVDGPGHTVNSGTLVIGEKKFITETYEGKGGTIQVSTLLKGADSETGMLVVNGKATGEGIVDVQVRKGSEARALDRLDVVTMAPGSTLTLELTDKEGIQYGEYRYMLVRTDKNSDSKRLAWYLTTTKKPQKTPDNPPKNPDTDDSESPDNASGQTPVEDEKNPATPDNQGGTGGGSGGSDVVWTTSTLKTPQAGARAGLAYLAAEVFDLSLRGHVGDRVYYDLLTGEERETSLWMLNMGNWSRFGDTTSQLGFDGRTNVTHLGGDLYKWNLNDTDTLRIGLLGSYGEADYNTKSDVTWLEADANFEGWSVGAYASWQTRAESGPFANGQIRWNRFENEVQEEGLEKDKYDSEGLSATFEAGWTQRLFTKKNSGGYNIAFDLEPRAHFYWMDFDAETGFDSTGQRFDTDGKSNLMTSLGVRASLKLTDDVMPQWNDPAMHFFVEGNWVHYSRDFNATVMNEKGSSTATVDLEDFAEARLGAVMHLSDDFLVWGDFNLRSGEDDYESYGYNVGAKYLY